MPVALALAAGCWLPAATFAQDARRATRRPSSASPAPPWRPDRHWWRGHDRAPLGREEQKARRHPQGPHRRCQRPGLLPRQRDLATGDLYKNVRPWDGKSKKDRKSIEVPTAVYAVAFLRRRQDDLRDRPRASGLRREDHLPAKKEPARLRLDNETTGIAVSRDGKAIVTAHAAGEVILWAVSRGHRRQGRAADKKPADGIPEFLPPTTRVRKRTPPPPGRRRKRTASTATSPRPPPSRPMASGSPPAAATGPSSSGPPIRRNPSRVSPARTWTSTPLLSPPTAGHHRRHPGWPVEIHRPRHRRRPKTQPAHEAPINHVACPRRQDDRHGQPGRTVKFWPVE